MLQVRALHSFSGINGTHGKGEEFTLAADLANSYKRAGLVEILKAPEPELETLSQVQKYLDDNNVKYDKRIKSVNKLKDKYGL